MPPIELRQIRYFLHLAEELNFSRAARKAYISQSSMTEQLQRLEDLLGTRLVDRTRRKVLLTPAGEVFRLHAEKVLKNVEELVETTQEASRSFPERLRIGYSEMALSSPMPRIIQNFRRQFPHTEIILLEQSSSGSEDALLQGTFDCLFVPDLQARAKISCLNLGDDPVLACLPRSSKLLENSSVQIEQLRHERLILPHEGSTLSRRLMAAFQRADIRPQIVARMPRATTMLTLAASEAGICFIPLSMASLVPAGVATRPFCNPTLTLPFSLGWRNEPGSRLVKRFVDVARETIDHAQVSRAASAN